MKKLSLAVAALAGLGLASLADAAIVEVKAQGGSKAVTMQEGETITLDIYIDLSGVAVDGLHNFNVSLRSGDGDSNGKGEWMGVPGLPVLWPVSPSPTDTVVNAGSSVMLGGADFKKGSWSNGSIVDLTSSLAPHVDQLDTDLDMKAMSGTQGTAAPFVAGYGKSSLFKIGTVDFTAPDLDDNLRPFDRQVLVNAFYTNASGGNGGAFVAGFTGSVIGANVITSQNLIGAPVTITVTNIPLPATAVGGLVGLVGVAALQARRRRHML